MSWYPLSNILFLYGDCGSFAIALQTYFDNGELYVLSINGHPVHAFVKINGNNVDVRGKRSAYDMAPQHKPNYCRNHHGFWTILKRKPSISNR
jgi:hypothetical protein